MPPTPAQIAAARERILSRRRDWPRERGDHHVVWAAENDTDPTAWNDYPPITVARRDRHRRGE